MAPAWASSLAVDSPIPDEAPVTIATFPSMAGRLLSSISLISSPAYIKLLFDLTCEKLIGALSKASSPALSKAVVKGVGFNSEKNVTRL